MMKIKKDYLLALLPVFAMVLCLCVQIYIPMNSQITKSPGMSYVFFLSLSIAIYLLILVIAYKKKGVREKLLFRVPFISGLYFLLNIYNLVTEKWMILSQIYFPYPDRVFQVYRDSYEILAKCLFYSFRLQLCGVTVGFLAGFITGISVGWSKKMHYWIQPIIKILGPIPAVAWIPIALAAFSSSFSASVFMVALSVWFPVTVLTSSGIQNLEASYFEVARTMGASTLYQIIHIAIPASMPSIFVGMFNGICSSFLALMSAEMLGVKYGIGWYVNWQREVMSYAHVYAGLLLIALFCYFFVTVLFKIRGKLLIWQKGIIKW